MHVLASLHEHDLQSVLSSHIETNTYEHSFFFPGKVSLVVVKFLFLFKTIVFESLSLKRFIKYQHSEAKNSHCSLFHCLAKNAELYLHCKIKKIVFFCVY